MSVMALGVTSGFRAEAMEDQPKSVPLRVVEYRWVSPLDKMSANLRESVEARKNESRKASKRDANRRAARWHAYDERHSVHPVRSEDAYWAKIRREEFNLDDVVERRPLTPIQRIESFKAKTPQQIQKDRRNFRRAYLTKI